MRKNLFVTYLTKSCLRVYISQLETTHLNMTTKNTKTPSDQRKQCIPVLQNRWSEGFLFFWLRGNLARHNRPTCKVPTAEASLGPQTTPKTLRSASKPRFSWPKSLESQVPPLPKPPQRKPYSVSAGQSFQFFFSRAVPYIDHKSLVRLALPNQALFSGLENHPSGCHELSGRTRRHLTASVTA